MEDTDFEQRLDEASPGTVIVYHRGDSLHGCKARRVALRAFYDGRADLLQRRAGDGEFEYLAMKKRRVEPPEYPTKYEEMIFSKTRKWGET